MPDDGDESVEGITLAWDEALDRVGWSRLESVPELEESPVLESDNSYVITELDEQEYETILELARGHERKYYWATANQDLWDLEAVEPEEEIFYTAYNEAGRKRRLFESYETARSGDRMLFYHSSPVQQIVGEGVVVEGLHEENRNSATSQSRDSRSATRIHWRPSPGKPLPKSRNWQALGYSRTMHGAPCSRCQKRNSKRFGRPATSTHELRPFETASHPLR